MPSLFQRARRESGARTAVIDVEPLAVAKLRSLLDRRRSTQPKKQASTDPQQDLRLRTEPEEQPAPKTQPEHHILGAHKADDSLTPSESAESPHPSPLNSRRHTGLDGEERGAAEREPDIVSSSPNGFAGCPDSPSNSLQLEGTGISPVSSPASHMAPSPTATRPPLVSRSPRTSMRPELSVDTGSPGSNPSPDFSTPIASDACTSSPVDYITPASPSMPPVSLASALRMSPATSAALSAPIEAGPSSLTSPGMPVRRLSAASSVGSPRRLSAVLHSPPMPLPIANLPKLVTPAGNMTPSWGSLALEGGPKSPALSRVSSRTSGSAGGGFPFFTPVSASVASPGPQQHAELTDDEVRRATKAMPVMLRIPSHRDQSDEDDGGEAEDADDADDVDDDESEDAVPTAPPLQSAARQGSMTPVVEESSRPTSALTTPTLQDTVANWSLHIPRTAQKPQWTSFPSPQEVRPAGAYFGRRPSAPSPSPSQETPSSGMTQDEDPDDATDVDDVDAESEAESSEPSTAQPLTPVSTAPRRIYSQGSHSMINLPTPMFEPPSMNLEPVIETPTSPPLARNESWARPPTGTPGAPSPHPLKRRLSAGDADPAPPKYEKYDASIPHPGPPPKPREEEGYEHLPGYWCGVHIEGTLARKMEFTQPGVQAKDRGWKKHYFVLHGTALYVYKFDPTKVPLRAGEPYLTCSEGESQQFLHVHLAPEHHRASVSQAAAAAKSEPKTARRATIGLESAISRGPIGALASRRGTVGSSPAPPQRAGTAPAAGEEEKVRELFSGPKRRQSSGADSVASSTVSAPIASHLPFAHNQLLHVYSLQSAESGLAADYKKRLHCVRVRAEGTQFMLQTDTARQCVQWIEAFQAATNVSMDLDTRPMPVQQTLPRRRRRRPVVRAGDAAATTAAAAATTTGAATTPGQPAFADTPEGNIAAVEAAERAARERERLERERDDMLAEDQAAERDAANTAHAPPEAEHGHEQHGLAHLVRAVIPGLGDHDSHPNRQRPWEVVNTSAMH